MVSESAAGAKRSKRIQSGDRRALAGLSAAYISLVSTTQLGGIPNERQDDNCPSD